MKLEVIPFYYDTVKKSLHFYHVARWSNSLIRAIISSQPNPLNRKKQLSGSTKKKVARMTLSEQTIFTPGVKTELVRRCPKTSKGSISSNSLWNRDDMYSKNTRKRADKCAARVFACFCMRMSKTRLKVDGTPENVPMYPYEINSRLSELSLLDFSAQVLAGATLHDLDPNERIRLKKIIKQRKGDKALLELSDEELDRALRLVKEENGELLPTVTGMLLIGKEDRLSELMPTAKASFQVLEGTQVRVNEQFSKPLLATFEIFENYMKAWNPEREMNYGLFRIPIPEFSEAAFREGLVNAFCHRDYSILQMVRLAIENEGL